MAKLPLQKEAGFLARYGIIGIATNVFLYGVFLALFHIGIGAIYAAGICYGLGVTLSYALNRKWTFSSNRKHRQDIPRFLIAYGAGLVFSMGFIALMIRFIPAEVAQILNVLTTAAFIYLCLRILKFGAARP